MLSVKTSFRKTLIIICMAIFMIACCDGPRAYGRPGSTVFYQTSDGAQHQTTIPEGQTYVDLPCDTNSSTIVVQ